MVIMTMVMTHDLDHSLVLSVIDVVTVHDADVTLMLATG